MACSGLHCAGCGGGSAAPVLALTAFLGVDWVAEHLAEVAITSAACGALAVAAVIVLMRWANRRDARQRAAASIWTIRAEPVTGTRVPDPLPTAERSALPFRDLHIHLDGQSSTEQAAVIRQALGR